jgi:hypothetical protein
MKAGPNVDTDAWHGKLQGWLGMIYQQHGTQHPAKIYNSPILDITDLPQAWQWAERITKSILVNWIDIDGNTPLVAILKYWPPEQNELELNGIVKELIVQGAQIHMRDRNGDTALAIAAVRGFRPAVATLLAAGANVHSRDFSGLGILGQAFKVLNRAKKEDDEKLYAKVLSCFVFLTDSNAIEEPTELDEWRIPDDADSKGLTSSSMLRPASSLYGHLIDL